MAAELTPMMRQYLAIKREVPAGAIVMFRLGDFYEMFGEDAIVAAPILGATLTHRGDQPMCQSPCQGSGQKIQAGGLRRADCYRPLQLQNLCGFSRGRF